jgi:hypothetical protein
MEIDNIELVPRVELEACKEQIRELNNALKTLSDQAIKYLTQLMDAKSEIIRLRIALGEFSEEVDVDCEDEPTVVSSR